MELHEMNRHRGMSRRQAMMTGTLGASSLLAASLPQPSHAATRRPNLVFVFSDQQRRHAIGCMNEDPVVTPNTDRFADDGLLFTNALSASPLCTPYRATLLTGRYPHSTGITGNGAGLRACERTIGTVLKSEGYQTAYIGKWHLFDNGIDKWIDWHFNQRGQYVPPDHRFGFDYWHATNCNHRTFWRLYYENSEEPAICQPGWQPYHDIDMAVDYLKNVRRPDTPFALFVSMVPPHNTHGPGFVHHEVPEYQKNAPQLSRLQHHAPNEYEDIYKGRILRRRKNVADNYGHYCLPGYFGACTGLDDQFGRLLDCIHNEGLDDDTIVVYTSDHGDMMGSHNRFGKSVWYEESIGIPFIIRWPGHVKTGREDILFNSVDVMPTLLGLIGIPIPGTVEGSDLSDVFSDEMQSPPESALIQLDRWRALRTNRYTYVVSGNNKGRTFDRFLYDRDNDPYQLHPLRAGDGSDTLLGDMQQHLETWLHRTGDPLAGSISS